jgi:hypothetical protein
MRKLNYLNEFPKLSKSNSFTVEGHVIYLKKDNSNTIYHAWLYPTGMLITVGITKDKIKELIQSRIHLLHALDIK